MGSVGYDMLNPEMIMIGTRKGIEETAVKARWLRLLYEDVCENNPRIEFGTWEEIEALKECDIKLQTYSSLEKICSSTKEKKAFYTQFKKDLI